MSLKTAYKKKREELLLAITGKKNFINLNSAAFVTVFARNLVHAYKFPIIQKNRWIIFFINLTILRSIVNKYTLQVQEHWKQGRLLNRANKGKYKMNLNILIKKEVKTKLWPLFLDMFAQAQMLSSETGKA